MSAPSPKFLFRYCGHPLWPEERPLENSGLKLLDKLTLKVTPPSHFNDPFEFRPVFGKPVSKGEARERLLSAIAVENRKRGLPPKLAQDLTDVVLSLKPGQDDLNFVAQQSVQPWLSDGYGVVCFSEVDDQPLMWAHYAAQHLGLVVEFDPAAPLFRTAGFVRVEYKPERSTVVPSRDHEFEQIVALATRKSPAWDYEREYRLVIPLDKTLKLATANGDIHLLKIEPRWIKSVTVGLRASVEIIAEINKLVRSPQLSHLHPQRYRMVMDSTTFRLIRQRVDRF